MLSKNFSRISSSVKCLCLRTKAENFRNVPKPNFDLYVISFIYTNFEAFNTFSAIFTVLLIEAISLPNFIGLGCLDQILRGGGGTPQTYTLSKSPVLIGLRTSKPGLLNFLKTKVKLFNKIARRLGFA